MKIRTSILLVTYVLIALIGTWAYLSYLVSDSKIESARNADLLISSLHLANQLRQSSEDLTRMARLYVTTGEKKYRDYFFRILEIRNGEKPRPVAYGGYYWDKVLNGSEVLTDEGEAIPLLELMRHKGFTDDEFELLKDAEDSSNALVNLENKAMKAIEGVFQDQDGRFIIKGQPDFELARSLMFGKQYHAAKETIMGSIDQFNRRIEERLRSNMNLLHKRGLVLSQLQLLTAFLTVMIMATWALLGQTVILRPLAKLVSHAKALSNGEYSTRLEISRRDEIGELSRTFNNMAEAINQDIIRRNQVALELLSAREKAEKADRAKSEFLSRISHELRTPLNGILGFAQLLKISELKPRQSRNVNLILNAGHHLLDLINEVLDISRVEAGELSLSPESVNLNHMLNEVIELMYPEAAKSDIALRKGEMDPKLCLQVDRQRLKQVLLNLASNAVKYNKQGGKVVFGVEEVSNVRCRILIADTGGGITPEDKAKVFQPFQRVGKHAPVVEGTGLGLALAQRMVEAMEGQIGFDSIPGEGSTFWVELPRSSNAETKGASNDTDKGTSIKPAERSDSLTVLYIEDNISNLHVVEQIMEVRPSVRLISALQGTLGLSMAQKHHPNLIFLDLDLPDMNGSEVLSTLKKNVETRDIPVIILSADAMTSQIERLTSLGATAYVTKPIDIHNFLDLLDEHATSRS